MKRPALVAVASLAVLALVLQPAAVDAFAFHFAVGALLKPFVRRPPPPCLPSSVFPPPIFLPQRRLPVCFLLCFMLYLYFASTFSLFFLFFL
jgi:hypothetical protein